MACLELDAAAFFFAGAFLVVVVELQCLFKKVNGLAFGCIRYLNTAALFVLFAFGGSSSSSISTTSESESVCDGGQSSVK